MKRLLFVAAVAALVVLSCPARSDERPSKPAPEPGVTIMADLPCQGWVIIP